MRSALPPGDARQCFPFLKYLKSPRSAGTHAGTVQTGSTVVDLISSIDKSAVTLWMRTSDISA